MSLTKLSMQPTLHFCNLPTLRNNLKQLQFGFTMLIKYYHCHILTETKVTEIPTQKMF
jgi:hypothetical protein